MKPYPVVVMLAVQVILCVLLVTVGGALLWIGLRGVRGTLPMNQRVGVRTAATLRSEEAFELGNRAAGPTVAAGGAAAVLAGVSLPMLASVISVVLVTVLGLVGGFALMVVGGLIGNRAAEALPVPEPAGGCGGCPGGCCATLS